MKELRLQIHADETDEFAAWLAQESPKTLQSLELSASELNNSLCQALSESKLRRLRVWSSDIDEEGGRLLATAVAHNSNIREFELVQNNIDDGAAAYLAGALAQSDHLRKFTLAHNDVSDPGLAVFQEAAQINVKCKTFACKHIS